MTGRTECHLDLFSHFCTVHPFMPPTDHLVLFARWHQWAFIIHDALNLHATRFCPPNGISVSFCAVYPESQWCAKKQFQAFPFTAAPWQWFFSTDMIRSPSSSRLISLSQTPAHFLICWWPKWNGTKNTIVSTSSRQSNMLPLHSQDATSY